MTTEVLEPVAASSPTEEPLYEVVNGQRVELTPMGAYPTQVASRLSHELAFFVKSNGLGEVFNEMLFLIDPATDLERRPDAAFISADRLPPGRIAPEDAAWEIVPDLCIEVVSPTDRAEEVLGKVRDYLDAGARAVWVAYPRGRVVHVYDSFKSIRVFGAEDDLDGGTLLPGFRLALATIFGPQAPDGA